MMEDSVNIIAFAFLFLAFGTLGLIFRDAFRHMNSDDQITFRRWIGRKFSLKTRAVNNVWTTHVRDWIFRGMSITHSEVKPIICSEANRSHIPRHADQPFRGQADQKFAAVGIILMGTSESIGEKRS
jgi:hypothetical protein